MSARDWYVPLSGSVRESRPDTLPRLFVFPHSGAGYARYSEFTKAVAPDLDVWAANLPGRQARLDEPPMADLSALVEELAERLPRHATARYGLFGYCGGALLAFLVARALRDRGMPPPAALIIASYEAPDIGFGLLTRRLATMPSDRLWKWLIEEGGLSRELAEEERLRRAVEPAVRADFSLLARYRYRPAPPLETPVTVCFGAGEDSPRGAWLGWRRQSVAPLRLRALSSGHWLLDQAVDELAKVVVEAFEETP
ncbi:thioesterase II family protein [Plantactinospora sp. WMMB782]|uniref:thioesterase II family protein n=1 Tax=Plantactinospora sp. WMMB782 TaxID=3404121 RepID=UPI003B95539B